MVFNYKKDITDYSNRDQFAHVIEDVFRIIGEETDLEKPEQSNRERDFDTHSYFESGLQIPTRQNMPARRPPVNADTRPLPKLDFSAILARTIKPRTKEKNPFFSLMAQSKKNKVKRVSFSFLEISKTHLPNCRRRGVTTEYGHLHHTNCKNYNSEKEMEKQEFHIRAEFIESNGIFSSDPAQFYTTPPASFEIPPLPASLNTVPGVMNQKSSTTDSLPYHEKNSPGIKQTPENSVFHKPALVPLFPQYSLDLRNEVISQDQETPATSSRTDTPPHELVLQKDEQPSPSSRASSVFSGDLDDDIMALLDESDSEGENEDDDDSSTKESPASSEEDCTVEMKSENRTDNDILIEIVHASPDSSPVKSLPNSNPILLGPITKTRTSFSDSGYGEEEEEENAPIITLSSRRRGAKKVKTWFENSTPATTAAVETAISSEPTLEQKPVVGFINPFTKTPVTMATVVKDSPSVLGGLVSRSVVAREPELTLPRHDPSIQEKCFKFDTPSRDDIVREAQGVLTK